MGSRAFVTARPRVLFLATEDWYFWSDKLAVARALRDRGWHVMVAAREHDHAARLRAEGFEFHPLRWKRGDRGLHEHAAAIAQLCALYRRVRPDVAHHVALKAVVLGAVAARLARVPRQINTVNGLGYVFTSDELQARLMRPVVLRALRLLASGRRTRLVAQNADDLDFLRRRASARPEQAVLIHGGGVDVERFRPLPPPPEPVVATLVARMLRDKGVGVFAEAGRLLRRRGVPVVLRLVGPLDPESPSAYGESELRASLADSGVAWEGFVDGILALWGASHVAVLPSIREGLPRALLEAAACGRPIVTTDVAGCREIVADGVNGLVVPPDDAVALAGAIERLVMDATARERMGIAAARIVRERFDARAMLDQWVDLHVALLGEEAGDAARPRHPMPDPRPR